MPKVSIIMPTYNVEKYFVQCLESVINQTLKDIEIIPVDDGSPDNCGKIMDEYAEIDSRIKPIHQINGGYGKAVNAGILQATGDYIGIVETDDFCKPEMFEILYNLASTNDADVAKSDFIYYRGQNKIEPCHNIKTVAPEGFVFNLKERPELFKFHVSIWSGIYKRSFIIDNQIKFEESKSATYQDMPFAALVYSKASRIVLSHEHLIYYRAEEGMNSSTIRTDGRLKMMPIQCQVAKQIFIENNCWNSVKEIAYKHFFNCSVGMFYQTQWKFKKAHYSELVKLFRDMKVDNLSYTEFTIIQKIVLKFIEFEDFKLGAPLFFILPYLQKTKRNIKSIFKLNSVLAKES